MFQNIQHDHGIELRVPIGLGDVAVLDLHTGLMTGRGPGGFDERLVNINAKHVGAGFANHHRKIPCPAPNLQDAFPQRGLELGKTHRFSALVSRIWLSQKLWALALSWSGAGGVTSVACLTELL